MTLFLLIDRRRPRRMRFLSPNQKKQETARLAGVIVSFVGAMLVMSGYNTEDLFLVGALLLI
ncbi:MAG: hypothetical protein OXN25_16560 [Candidatus Poribacteria bacterium]|nr:hypothetical protein [Candidatus Poribacteria bacterium]